MRHSLWGVLVSLAPLGCGGTDTKDGTERPAEVPAVVTVSAFDVADARLRTVLTLSEPTLGVHGINDRTFSRTCTRRVEGACAVVACDNAAYANSHPRPIDAGEVRFAGGVIPSPGLVAVLDPYGEYRVETPIAPRPVVREENIVSVTGAGAAFPRFDVRMNRPTAIELSAPRGPASEEGHYPLRAKTLFDSDYAVAWSSLGTPAEGAQVHVQVRSPVSPSNLTADPPRVECAFPAAAGRGTVPARLVHDLFRGRVPTEQENLDLQVVPMTVVELSAADQDQVLSIRIHAAARAR